MSEFVTLAFIFILAFGVGWVLSSLLELYLLDRDLARALRDFEVSRGESLGLDPYQPELPFEENVETPTDTTADLGRLIRRTAFVHEPGANPSAYQASRRTAEAILEHYIVTQK